MRSQIQILIFVGIALGIAAWSRAKEKPAVAAEMSPSCSSQKSEQPAAQASLKFSIQKTEKPSPGSAANIIFQSDDSGASWHDVSEGLPKSVGVSRVFGNEKELALATNKGLFRKNSPPLLDAWVREDALKWHAPSDVFASKQGIFVNFFGENLLFQSTGAAEWTDFSKNLENKRIRTMVETSNGNVLVGLDNGIFKTSDRGATWQQVFDRDGINGLAEAGDGSLVAANFTGMMRSTDGGATWQQTSTNEGAAFQTTRIAGGGVASILDGQTIWQRSFPQRHSLLLSTDGGATWQHIEQNLPFSKIIYDVEQAGDYLFCSTDLGVSRSADGGKTWEMTFPRDPRTEGNLSLAVCGGRVFVVLTVGC